MKTTFIISLCLILSCSASDPNKPIKIPETEQTPETEETTETEEIPETETSNMRTITPQEMVLDMGSGWNLGNAMDTRAKDKTTWGNPITTKAMIDEIANKGFKTLRLPVTWQFDTGSAPDYIIENDFLNRVEEIANYAFDNNMYVILNIHHDDSWFVPTNSQAEEVKDRLAKVWTQIADRFKDYNDYLIFENLNEPRHKDTPEEWNGGTAEGREVLNQYQETILAAIRATGGNNGKRKVMVSTYAASTSPNALNDYRIPNDDENVIVSVHSYYPYQFALQGSDADWGTEADKTALIAELDKIHDQFVANGRAVVMGEWGSTNTDNLQDRLRHAKFYAQACAERQICPIWWDNGNKDEFGIFNRNALTWNYPEIADAIIEATKKP